MDNYQVAINGTGLAARILGIETPEVQFFYNLDLTEKGINSVFLKEKYIIAFNEEWIEQANQLEIQITCFHETRHAFQWKCICGEVSSGDIDQKDIIAWKKEMSEYTQPSTGEIPEEAYLKQEIEIDAIAFAHYQIKKLYNVNSIVPKAIKAEVEYQISKFGGSLVNIG